MAPPPKEEVIAAYRAYCGAGRVRPTPEMRPWLGGVMARQFMVRIDDAMRRWHRDEYPGTLATHYTSLLLAVSLFEFSVGLGAGARVLNSNVEGIKTVLRCISEPSVRLAFRPRRKPAAAAPQEERDKYAREIAVNTRDARSCKALRALLLEI